MKKKTRVWQLPGRCVSGTAEMKDIRPARPKNLATNTVAWPWASGLSIHCRQGRRMHDSLHPFRRTRQPLQLISSADYQLKWLTTSFLPPPSKFKHPKLKLTWKWNARTEIFHWYSETRAFEEEKQQERFWEVDMRVYIYVIVCVVYVQTGRERKRMKTRLQNQREGGINIDWIEEVS